MEDVTLDDLMEQLDSAKRERLPDPETIQGLRWRIGCYLVGLHFGQPDGTPQADEPTHAETLSVCHRYQLQNDLNHINLVAAWTYARFESETGFMVVEKLPSTIPPSDTDIQAVIASLVEDISQDMLMAEAEDQQSLAPTVEALRQMKPEDVRTMWTMCMLLGIPPFPTVGAETRQ